VARDTVNVGLAPVYLDNDRTTLAAFQSYLERRLGRTVRFVERASYDDLTRLLRSGRLDAAWICTNPYLQFRNEYTVLGVPVYHGQPLYRSYIIVADTEPQVRTLQDLRGKVFAFSDPDSNSGYLVVRRALAGLGERPQTFFRRSFFTNGHRQVVYAVAAGLAHGGAVESYVWDRLRSREPEVVHHTRIISRSRWFGFPPIVAPIDTDGSLRDAFSAALLEMEADPSGRKVLQRLALDRFITPPPDLYATPPLASTQPPDDAPASVIWR